MTTALAPLIAAASSGDTITLQSGEYDDADRIVIEKRLQIVGPLDAVVHSEFVLYNAFVRFCGFTMEMNKIGSPSHTGIVFPYPQNGMVTSLNSQFWSDDVDWRSWRPADWADLGYPVQATKPAVHACGSPLTRINAMTRHIVVDWRGNDAQVFEQYYGGVLYLIDNSPQLASIEIRPGTSESHGGSIAGVNAHVVMSGAYIYDHGTSPYGVCGGRKSYVQVGAGVLTEIYKPTPVVLDATSSKWVAPGCLG